MPSLTEQAHAAVRASVRPGEDVIDATAGNGFDTLFLAQLVGPGGHVYAFDILPAALAETARRLQSHAINHVTLLERSHAELRSALPAHSSGQIAAVMFNLGYLPGSDKQCTTQPDSTAAALRAALTLLRPGGILTVLAYVGHPGGAADAEAALNTLQAAITTGDTLEELVDHPSPRSPRLWVVRRSL